VGLRAYRRIRAYPDHITGAGVNGQILIVRINLFPATAIRPNNGLLFRLGTSGRFVRNIPINSDLLFQKKIFSGLLVLNSDN
jgi:hypothetical protein